LWNIWGKFHQSASYSQGKRKRNPINSQRENKVLSIEAKYDDDVQEEMKKIEDSSPKDYVVRVNHLRKVYSTGKVAVDKLSFGANYGECFGLLGVNGAG